MQGADVNCSLFDADGNSRPFLADRCSELSSQGDLGEPDDVARTARVVSCGRDDGSQDQRRSLPAA